MKQEVILSLLDGTGIAREEDFAVPVNGVTRKLPYMVVRRKETIEGDDLGRIRIVKTEWTVALFTTNREDALEQTFCKVLSGAGKVEVTRFPDGTPYQTNFEFTTKQTMK